MRFFNYVPLTLVALTLIHSGASAQRGSNAAAAGVAAIAAGVSIAITADHVRDQLELEATNYILKNYPEKDCFELELLEWSATKDVLSSNVRIRPFAIAELDKNTLVVNGREVLLTILSDGWINDFGVDITKVSYVMLDVEAWDHLFTAFLRMVAPPLVGGKSLALTADSVPIYIEMNARDYDEYKDDPQTLVVVSKENQMVRTKRYRPARTAEGRNQYTAIGTCRLQKEGLYSNYNDVVLPIRSMGSNQYLVSDYSEDFDIVLTDDSFGLFLKREGSLVKLKKSTANEIHKFLHGR